MKTTIIGLGKTGLSCARYLAQHGDELTICDTREQPPGLVELDNSGLNVQRHFGALDSALLSQADRIVISPGLSIHHPALALAREKNIPILGDVELFAQKITAPVVAITGSNGKSTVTTLVGMMAQAAGINAVTAGNIGVPVCDLLDQPEAALYVLELSSFQLATTYSLQPAAATVLNVTPDHLDWHGDFQDYQQAKLRVYHKAKQCIYNRDDAYTLPPHDASYSFGVSVPQDDSEFGLREGYLMQGEKQLFAIAELKLVGLHNQLNALAALALGTAIDLPLAAMQQVLRSFAGLAHRCQWVADHQGVQWYNDSKATNIASTISSLTSVAPLIQGKIVLIGGGDAKGADLRELQPIVRQTVRSVIVYGKDAPGFQTALADCTEVIRVTNLQQAVATAAEAAQSGDAVLLAPACASTDMFTDYQQRGMLFKEAVLKLCQNQ
ncbi:MAG: UDP-N-acetylmuramoyl-L-alanine--D-glutamate ligase [Gammaproteobacteria bacterium]|nr:UDP-N-acetylmuramoyl-L-alanine--D-glutamate ligase [Gammaproteobacteria bacterium]